MTATHYKTGQIKTERWMVDGQLHRDGDLPALVDYYPSGKPKLQAWYRNGQRHRDGDRPALVTYAGNGTLESEEWYQHGDRIRTSGPCLLEYYTNGVVRRRIDVSPELRFSTEIHRHRSGAVTHVEWTWFDVRHWDEPMSKSDRMVRWLAECGLPLEWWTWGEREKALYRAEWDRSR